MNEIKEQKLKEKPMFPLLFSMACPPMISMLVQSLYNIVDSVFVAKIGESALASVTLAFPIQMLILSVAVGLGIGMNSYLSRCFGAQKHEEANEAILHGITFACIASTVFILFGIFFSERFIDLFTDDLDLLEKGVSYLRIIAYGGFSCIFYILIEKIFQSTGNMIVPMIIQIFGAVINVVLDPILIFGIGFFPSMGVTGAALATVIAQFISVICIIFVFIRTDMNIKLKFKNFKIKRKIVREILNVALPATTLNALGSFLIMGLNAILIQFSNTAVAFYGIFYKLQTFIYMPVSGVIQGAMPIMGYSYGAKNFHRLFSCLKKSLQISFFIIVSGFIIFMVFPTQLITMFQNDATLLEIGIPGMRILSIAFLPAVFGCMIPTFFQAIGKGEYAFIIYLLRQFIITLPFSYILSKVMGINGIWISFIIAESIAAGTSILLFQKIYKRLLSES